MRLIDADAFEKWAWRNPDVVVDGDGYVLPYAASNFAEEHTIDAVPVVRCQYCQSHHWEQEPCHGKTVHYCKKLDAEVTADFFCAAGKRKDGEG